MVAIEMGKKDTLSVIVTTVAKRIEYVVKNMNLLHSKHYRQNWVDWIRVTLQKFCNLRKVHFQ